MLNFNKAEFCFAGGTSSQLPEPTLPEIVFSGRSNVGKSSLLNRLLNRKNLAHVSSTPGKTVTINLYRVDSCFFADLPGYGFARRSKQEYDRFAELMEGYFGSDRPIATVVQLIDMRREATDDDLTMIDFMLKKNLPFIIVLTKSDKLNKTEYKNNLSVISNQLSFLPEGTQIIPFSSTNGDGTELLKNAISQATEKFNDVKE